MGAHQPYRGGPEPYDRTTGEIPRFAHGRARPRDPDRYTGAIDHDAANAPHLRAVRTGEQPRLEIIEMPDPWTWWDSAILWIALVCSLLSLAVTGVVAVQIMQLRAALENRVVVVPAEQISPAPVTE